MRAGEDPNFSNPVVEAEQEPPLDPNDPEVQSLNNMAVPVPKQDNNRQPTVIEVPDEHDLLQGHLAQSFIANDSLHPSRAPSVPPQSAQTFPDPPSDLGENYYHNPAPPEVSPLAPSSADRTFPDGGGGYFPAVPENVGRAANQNMSDSYGVHTASSPGHVLPDHSSLPHPESLDYQTPLPPPPDSIDSFASPGLDTSSISRSPISISVQPSAPPPASTLAYPSQPATISGQVPQKPPQPAFQMPKAPIRQNVSTAAAESYSVTDEGNYEVDEESILKAQKHARWAISALNFEDVNTAVKELRGALKTLGAS